MNLKSNLADLVKNLEGLEATARSLPNQNFADIVMTAKGRLSQLVDHPDLSEVQVKMYGPEANEPGTDPKPNTTSPNAPSTPAPSTPPPGFVPPVS